MAMTMEERIEAAAKHAFFELNSIMHDHEKLWKGANKPIWRDVGKAAIRAAFPELFDGTAWLAPWEPTPAILRALARLSAEDFRDDARDWAVMRDAHLSPETDAKVEG